MVIVLAVLVIGGLMWLLQRNRVGGGVGRRSAGGGAGVNGAAGVGTE